MSVTTLVHIAAAVILLASCSHPQGSNTSKDQLKTFPVLTLKYRPAQTYADYPASIQGIENIEIRPKIDGYIDAVYVDEGSNVKKGQILFRISAPQYEQDVKTAEANINIAVAEVDAAKMQVNKVRPLVEKDIVSAYELESAQYTLQSKQAVLDQAKAELSNAQTNLSYTKIFSPSDGVIGILPYKIGSLITSTTANPLTTVSNIKKIYAYFSINEKQGLDFFTSAKGGTMQEKLATLPPVTLVLANGSLLPNKGKVETASGLINTQTGSINMRATFPNDDGLVRSGSSAVVRIPSVIDTALLVPQEATYQIQGKIFVYVLDKSNQVNSVEITTNVSSGAFYVVKQGVKSGDRVVIDGIGNLRENLKIIPREVPADSIFNQL